jgi:hypothetical protein
MWENCFYVGGEDDGVLEAEGKSVGVALCWELMRSQTARRLRGRVDVVLAGSGLVERDGLAAPGRVPAP